MSHDIAHQMQQQVLRTRREQIRWYLLVALNVSRPAGAVTQVLLCVIQATYPDATEQEIRRELDYLEDRKLVNIQRDPLGRWLCELTHYGVDIAEYTTQCFPGIARPAYAGC